MENKKSIIFKVLMSIIFALGVFGMLAYVVACQILKKSCPSNILIFACIGACFIFSLMFVKIKNKNLLITLALAVNVVADYFLVLMPSEKNKLIGLCVFCGVQFIYLIYSLMLSKGVGLKIFNIALRVTLCLLAYFILPRYITLASSLEMIAVMYILNSFVTLLVLLCNLKTQWLMFFGFLLFFVCDIFVGFTNGGIEILNITGPFVEFLAKYDMTLYCYVPGIYLIALHSVWAKKS